MPAVRPSVLIDAIIDSIEQSEGNGIYIPDIRHTHPRKFLVNYLDQNFSIWVYIWTLTHGGRPSLPNEYRIQMTSVNSPLPINPDGYTSLLGYYPDLHVFTGFDLQQHRIFTTGSPSVQVGINTIYEALQFGLSFSTKTNFEIVIGIRPDHMLNYVLNSIDLHRFGRDAMNLPVLIRASQSEVIPDQDIDSLPPERRRVVTEVRRFTRAVNFRQQVLNAYNNRCAVTRSQLKLVDAAHILPVPEEGSIDHVTNGIALSPTIHRAFDNGLVYLDTDYNMRLNERRIRALRQDNLIAGLEQLRIILDTRIHLPADQNQWPNIDYITRANIYRRIPGFG